MKARFLLGRWQGPVGGFVGTMGVLLAGVCSSASPVAANPFDIPPVEKPQPVTRSSSRHTKLVEASSLINAVVGRNSHNVNGAGLCAAILDTGINTTHVDFTGKIVVQRNYTGDNSGSTTNAEDGQGHGTNVAGIVGANSMHTGIAPGAKLAVFKVLSNSGGGSSASIVSALQWIRDNGDSYNISVVNMSLGDSGNYQTEQSGDPYRSLIQQLRAKNIPVVISAGNSFYPFNSAQGMAAPAIDRECVSVGAVYDANIGSTYYGDGAAAYITAADRIAPFSQRLHSLVSSTNRTDIFAPGAALTSSGIGSTQGESVMHGTSQAAPVVAGSILLFQQKYKALHGKLPSVDLLESMMRADGKTINDGDDEKDNVTHTNQNYQRVDVKATLDDIVASNAAPVPATSSASLATWAGRSIINRPDRASDADGDTLTWSKSVSPAHGTLSVDSSDGLFLYVPASGYTGSDSFTLSVADQAKSATVTYSVAVGAAPASGTRIYTAVGASDANGYGASDYAPTLTAGHGYTALLEGKFKISEGSGGGQWVLSNRGVNGFTAPDLTRTVGGQSVLSLALADGAAAYTLWIGPNDVLHLAGIVAPSETGSDFSTAFSTVVSGLKQTGAALVVCNVPQLGALPAFAALTTTQKATINTIAQNLNTGIASACSNASVPVVDLYNDPNSTNAANISSDGFHPNDTGYGLLADKIWPYLTARVSLRPYVAGVTPSSATSARGATQTFAIHVKDINGLGAGGQFNGASAINQVWFTANRDLNWDGGASFLYMPSASDITKGMLYGRINGGQSQSAIGAGGTVVQSDGASVDAAQVSVALDSDGTGITVTLPVTAGAMPTSNTVWVIVRDAQNQVDAAAPAGMFGNVVSGSWTVTSSGNAAPVLTSVTPATGTMWSVAASGYSQSRTITLSGTDADGVNDIESLWLLVGSNRTWTGTGTLFYQPRYHALWLRNDAGDGWLGPVYLGGSGAVLENSSVKVDASAGSETRTATGVSVTMALQVKTALRGQPKVWGRISDQSGAVDGNGDDLGFLLQGNWNVGGSNAQNSAPVVESVTPNSSSSGGNAWTAGTEREAVVEVSDVDGAGDIQSAWILVAPTLDWDSGATLIYEPSVTDPTKGTLYLRDSTQSSGFQSAAITGAQMGALSTGKVSVRLSGVSVETTNDGHLKVHLPLTFSSAMTGSHKVWGRAQDRLGATDTAAANGALGFVLKGGWVVSGPSNRARAGGGAIKPSSPSS